MDEVEMRTYKSTSFKVAEIKRFLNDYALESEKEEMPDQMEAKNKEKAEDEEKKDRKEIMQKLVEIGASNFTQEVENTEDGCLVYFTTLESDKDIGKEWKSFKEVSQMIENAIKLQVFRMDPNSEDFVELKKTYKVPKLDAGKPQLRFYPNKI